MGEGVEEEEVALVVVGRDGEMVEGERVVVGRAAAEAAVVALMDLNQAAEPPVCKASTALLSGMTLGLHRHYSLYSTGHQTQQTALQRNKAWRAQRGGDRTTKGRCKGG